MAVQQTFGNTGTFGNQNPAMSPIDQLLQAAKNKKTQTAAAQPANVFAPSAAAPAVAAPEKEAPTTGTTEAPVTAPAPTQNPEIQMSGALNPAEPMPTPPPGITPETHYISGDPNSPYYWETLGYADDSWVGLPYEMGWYTGANLPDEFLQLWPEARQWVQQRDMRPLAERLHELYRIGVPDRPELTDITTSAPYGSITNLLATINDPNTAAADRDAAIAQFEREMGQQPGWYAQQMAGMYGDISQGVFNRQGMPQDQQSAYNRETQLELQGMKDNYKMLMESMGASGRSVAGYQKMDEIANSLSTFEMKRDLERINLDNAMKQTEYDALKDRWEGLYNMGQMTAQQFVSEVQANRTTALQGYAQQISALVQNNQLTLDAYRADLEAVQTHAQVVYQGIMADIGISQAMMEEMQSRYEMYYAPYYLQLEQWSIQQQVQAQEEANQIQAWSAIPIVGPIYAAASQSVICTELHRQGLMDDDTHFLDSMFGQRIIWSRPDIYAGYLILATPIVKKMRKSKTLTRIVNFFVRGWSAEMKYRMEKSKTGSILGKIIMGIGFPLCSMIGGLHGCKLGPAESR